LEIDGAFLKEANPELLTVSCAAGVAGMKAVKDRLPNAEVLGVTVLTSLPTEECQKIHGHAGMAGAVGRSLAQLAKSACLDGIVCSPAEVSPIRDMIGPSMSINTPAIRPAWANVIGDDQNKDRVMTPKEAIRAGADRIIVGRPIFQARDPYDAVMRVLEEIAYTQ
jgi:orotidine-5'-phosphate decarboxylase